MMKPLFKFYKKESFQPGFLAVFINPFFFIRRSLYLAIKNTAPQLSGKMMDFGCGRKPYQNLFVVEEYVGVDIKVSGHDHNNSLVDIYYDGETIPVETEYFDSVFCSEVLEHLFEPDKILREINRTMKPGGRILLTAPFCWNEHEIPYDYARYSSFGIRYLLEKNGFTVINEQKTGSFMRVIVQLITLYIYEGLKKWKVAGLLISLLIIAPINIVSSFLLPLFPSNKSLYFNNVIVAAKN